MPRADDHNRDDLTARRMELEAAVRGSTVAHEGIRELVHSLVDDMRQAGEPPEKVVIVIKTTVMSALDASAAKRDRERAAADKVLRDCLGWGVKRYYEATE